MTIKLPGTIGYKQTNRSDKQGSLWSTFNIDLQSNLGAVRVSPRLRTNTSTTDDAQLGVPVAFKFFADKILAICGTSIFTNNGEPDDAFTEDASTGFQTDYSADESDMEVFNVTVCASTTDGLFSWSGSDWTQRDVLTTGGNHAMVYFKKFNRLYYVNGVYNILSIDTSWVTADPGADYAIAVGDSSSRFIITCLESDNNYIWIGVVSTANQITQGKVLRWDGISAQITDEYPINNAQGIMALAINPVSGLPFVMDSNGILSEWSGSGFGEVGRLPIPESYRLPYNVGDIDNERFMHMNGMYFTKNGTLRCLVNNRTNVSGQMASENFPSGIWEWSKENGFVHIRSFTYTPRATDTITDFGQNMVSRVGALASMNVPSTNNVDGTMMVGATVFTDASSTTSAIFFDNSLDTVQKYGYLVTTKIFSSEVEDTWQNLYTRHKKLLDSADSIVTKYRVSDVAPTEITITWTSATTFTTTTDVSALVGYEVEVIQGKGSGKTAHIVTVTGSGTFTVTVDDSFTGATSGTAKARLQNWKKIGSQTDQTLKYFKSSIMESDTWVQLKICMQFDGTDEIDDFILTNKTHEPAT